ncbi:MAG: hypothetical protein J2P37_33040 [Ktedonobacteraceae bacterium]|nr:hypothetical protein [Ktedonobacteraceae bacterium]MBO0791065.1 hypothetical protein [Ktedonobacteraceae bacterium]
MPKKEEFPTFLNEQPTIIFGRTGRELLVIVVGIVGGYFVWSSISGIRSDIGWMILTVTLTAVPVLVGLVVALVPVGERPLEEWFFVWLLYIGVPKVYIYKPAEEEAEISEGREAKEQALKKQKRSLDPDDLLED